MARFYADEQFPFPVVEFLRTLGHDVLTVQSAGNANQGIPDEDVLAFAISNSRAVLTLNRDYFIRLHRLQSIHAGIIVCTKDDNWERLARRIDEAIYTVETLSSKLIRVTVLHHNFAYLGCDRRWNRETFVKRSVRILFHLKCTQTLASFNCTIKGKMSKPKQASGCQKMLRRTFLFLFGMAATQVLAEYFSVTQNRDNTVKVMSQLWQKLLALRSNNEPDVTPTPVNNGPIAQKSPTPQTSIINEKDSPNIEPFGHQGKSQLTKIPPKKAQPLQFSRKTVGGVSFYQTTIDMTDPETFINIGLANNATFANNATLSNGDEPFQKLVDRYKAAVIVSGTFFGKDTQKAVLGNMVAGGKFLKYSRWENYGTTLGIKAGNQLEMVTARIEGQPQWNEHWFSLTCGPRLVKQGKVWLSPLSEGFKDSHVLGVGARSAIGFPASKQQLFLVTFLQSLSLQQEAEIMKAIGCMEAMNLDGGASVALARKGRILLPPGRNLTNVIVVYDTEYRAPQEMKMSWQRFQNGDRPLYP